MAITVRRASDGVSTRTASTWRAHSADVVEWRRSNDGAWSPQSASRFSRARWVPRSEKPILSSTVWPASAGPVNSSPNGRSVVGLMSEKSIREPPGIRRRSYQSSCRIAGLSISRCTARGAPSTTISPHATPGASSSSDARSGTVEP